MRDDLIRILNESDLGDYLVSECKNEVFELFFVGEKLETVRRVDTVDTAVTVYMRGDGSMGSTTFNIYESTGEEELREKIRRAKESALKIKDRPYHLVENEKADHPSTSNFSGTELSDIAERVARAVFAAAAKMPGQLNATEIFAKRFDRKLINSRGVEKREDGYDVMIETIPTFDGEEESVEIYEQFHVNHWDEEEIEEEITQKMREVKARAEAKKPTAPLRADVLLRAEELAELFRAFSYQLSYAALFRKANLFSVGDAVQTAEDHDRFTLYARGEIDGVIGSGFFDGDGSAYQDTLLIERGVVRSFCGGKKFAEYLGMENTGNLPLIEVLGGSVGEAELKSRPHLECISFSGIQVDEYNDYIGGEVRLALYFDGKHSRPITGISISAKLSDVLNRMTLSREIAKIRGYCGPRAALFEGFAIS